MKQKMVIVRGNTHWIVDGTPKGGDTNDLIGRFILQDGKIVPQILKKAYLPRGREQEAIIKYQALLANYIDPVYAHSIPKDLPMTVLETILPDQNPEKWLKWMWQTFPKCSNYTEQEDSEFQPLESDFLEDNEISDLPAQPTTEPATPYHRT